MVALTTVDELHEELLRSGDDLERLRRETAQLRRESATRFDASREQEDSSVALTVAEEQEAITAWDEARRENLQRRLIGV